MTFGAKILILKNPWMLYFGQINLQNGLELRKCYSKLKLQLEKSKNCTDLLATIIVN